MKKIHLFILCVAITNHLFAWDDASHIWRNAIEGRPYVAVISDLSGIISLPLIIPYCIYYSVEHCVNGGDITDVPGMFFGGVIIYPAISFPITVCDICLLGIPLSKLSRNDPFTEAFFKPVYIDIIDKVGNHFEKRREDKSNKAEETDAYPKINVENVNKEKISTWNIRKK